MKIFRHGEVIIKEIENIPEIAKKINHLILAEGEITGHKHEIVTGKAELYENNGILFLKVESDTAELIHPEHITIVLPAGNYEITIQKEYSIGDEKYKKVLD